MSATMQLCSAHKKMRLEKFMVSRNVLDADGKVVDIKWTCHADSQCTTGPMGALVGAPPPPAAGGSGSTVPAPLPTEKSDAMKLYGGETKGRYFDLSAQTGGIDNTVKKVCFSCGLADHERGDCPNQFCRTCRDTIPPGGHNQHTCVEPPLSDLVDLKMPTPEEIASVRCSVCYQLGHFDCAELPTPKGFRASCCSCGDTGHHGFQCPNAPHDRWLTHQMRLLGQTLTDRRQNLPAPQDYTNPEVLLQAQAAGPSPTKASAKNEKRGRDGEAPKAKKTHMAEAPAAVATTKRSPRAAAAVPARRRGASETSSSSDGDCQIVAF